MQKIEKQKRVPIVSDLVLVYKWSKWLLRVKKAMKQKEVTDGVDAAKPAYLEVERKRILHAAADKLKNVVEDGPRVDLGSRTWRCIESSRHKKTSDWS
eukprot:g14461.t1